MSEAPTVTPQPHPDHLPPDLADLSLMGADELTARLAAYFRAAGGLALATEKLIARELVRRARLLEGRQGGRGPGGDS